MERKLATRFYLKRQRRKRRKLFQILLLIFLGIIAAYFIFNYFVKKTSGNFSVLTDPFISSRSNFENNENTEIKNNPLGDIVEAVLKDSEGDYAIFIKNLKTGESYTKNEDKIYETGSLYKLWVMVVTFKQIQEGLITEDEVLKDSIAGLNKKFNINSEDAEMTSGTIDMTVAEAVKQMITISHNYGAMLLTDKIKVSSVEYFLKSTGFTSSNIGNDSPPKSTVSDIALFLEKLYKGELSDPIYTTKMLDVLKAQTFDGGLPKYLPEKTIIANKTGDIGWFKHDAGIIFVEKGDYIIVVMSESNNPAGAQERIALISKAVYEYFTQQN